MATSYTSLLGLALPVTGELSGTWGDTVNDYITQYLDAAIAGTQTISGSQTAVTLSKTTNASLGQAGSGATGSSQYQIINCTGNPASELTVTVPAASKEYIVINATSTSQNVKIVGAGPTAGVTVVSGERCLIAWNGSDFVKIGGTNGAGSFTTLTTSSTVTLNGGTANGVAYLDGSKVLTTGSALTFDGTNFATTGSVTSAGASNSGNLNFTGTGNRITGDFSNATIANRVMFQASTTDNNTFVGAIPNGSAGVSEFFAYSSSDVANASYAGMTANTSAAQVAFESSKSGTGTYLPMTFYTGGSERVRIDTAGQVGIGFTSLSTQGNLQVYKGISGGAPATSGSTDANQVFAVNYASVQTSFGAYANGAAWIQQRAGGNFAVNYDLVLQPNGGNVGIGTSSPGAKLQVNDGLSFGLQIGKNTSNNGMRVYDVNNNLTLASNLSVTVVLDANNDDSTGTFKVVTNGESGTELLTLNESGNLGIGTSSPAWKLDVNGIVTSRSDSLSGMRFQTSANGYNGFVLYETASTSLTVNNYNAGPITFKTNDAERARIDSSGNLLVGTTTLTSIGSGYNSFNVAGTNGAGAVFKNTAGSQISYVWCDAANRLYCVQNTGGVYLTSGATSWTANSDERQKDIIESITDAANKVATLRAVIGKYKTDDEGVRRAFLIAQDVQAVLPEAVDASDPEKLGVQYTDTIPLLVAAIQELKAELDTMKAELQTLKGN